MVIFALARDNIRWRQIKTNMDFYAYPSKKDQGTGLNDHDEGEDSVAGFRCGSSSRR